MPEEAEAPLGPPDFEALRPLSEVVPGDPKQAYADCGARIEGEERAGECSSDADCVRAGCSQEVCVPTSVADEVFTTCETRLCFMAVDQCGCTDEGFCRWSLKPAPAESD